MAIRLAAHRACVAGALCAAVAVIDGCGPAPRPRQPESAAMRRVLWHDPGPVASLDLSWSDRARFRRPVPPFVFVKEDKSGTRAKVRVRDADGVEWNVKLAGDADDTAEVHAEVAAERIVWALGYFVERGYYVSDGTIDGVTGIHRASRGLTRDGHFRAARFKERSRNATGDRWTFAENPFLGTRELSGLMILMTMIGNWDLTPENMAVLRDRHEDGTRELRYLVADLGATFGHMEDVRFPFVIFSTYPWTNWNARDYARQPLVDSVHDGRVRLHYRGEIRLPEIPLEHARWFAALAGQLTPRQLRQAFEAAGATPAEVESFSSTFLRKVQILKF